VQGENIQYVGIIPSVRKDSLSVSVGWLLFSTNTMDMPPLKESILEHIQDIPVGATLEMINMGIQGVIKLEDQVCTFHVFVNKLDLSMAKPLLMAVFASCPSIDHIFPLHVQMRLVPEIDLVLNTKGQKLLINYMHVKILGTRPSWLILKHEKLNFSIVKAGF